MTKKNKEEKILTKPYDKTDYFWAVIYGKKQVVAIYPRKSDASWHKFQATNVDKSEAWKSKWWIKKFLFKFKGDEIDVFEYHRVIKKVAEYIMENYEEK